MSGQKMHKSNGKWKRCTATRQCPFGGAPHVNSIEEARAFDEKHYLENGSQATITLSKKRNIDLRKGNPKEFEKDFDNRLEANREKVDAAAALATAKDSPHPADNPFPNGDPDYRNFLKEADGLDMVSQRAMDLREMVARYKNEGTEEEATLPIYTKNEDGSFSPVKVLALSEEARKVRAFEAAVNKNPYLENAYKRAEVNSKKGDIYLARGEGDWDYTVNSDPETFRDRDFTKAYNRAMLPEISINPEDGDKPVYYRNENGDMELIEEVRSYTDDWGHFSQATPLKLNRYARGLAEAQGKSKEEVAKKFAEERRKEKEKIVALREAQRREENYRLVKSGRLTVEEGRKMPLNEFYQHWEERKNETVGVEREVEVPKKGWRGLLLGETERKTVIEGSEPSPANEALRKVRESFSPEAEQKFQLYMEAKSVRVSPEVLSKIETSFTDALSRQKQEEVDAIVNRQKTKDELFLERLNAANRSSKESLLDLS